MNNLLIGQAINVLWRQMKVFVLGGAACGDNQGIGNGPPNYNLCREGKAWYLYYWHENNVMSLTSHKWGWMDVPPGADQLGSRDCVCVTVQVKVPATKLLPVLPLMTINLQAMISNGIMSRRA